MVHFADGSVITTWPRGVALLSPDRSPVGGQLSGEALRKLAAGNSPAARPSGWPEWTSDFPPGAHLSQFHQRIIRADELYLGSIPGLGAAHHTKLEEVRRRIGNRLLAPAPRVARPTLPLSVVRRAAIIEDMAPSRILVTDDPDGLSILLAEAAAVTLASPSEDVSSLVVRSEAARAGVELVLPTDGATYDVAVVPLGPPDHSVKVLADALAHIPPGGRILATLARPWEVFGLDLIEQMGLDLIHHHREVDHVTVAGGFVLDGAGDVLVLGVTSQSAPVQPPTPTESAAIQPGFWLDFDALAPENPARHEDPLAALADALALYAPRPEAGRNLHRESDASTLNWCDAAGTGLTVHWRPEEGHLVAGLAPFDGALEYAVISAVFHTLGDPMTRMRPQVTGRWGKEVVVG